jgi:hypothetical protein
MAAKHKPEKSSARSASNGPLPHAETTVLDLAEAAALLRVTEEGLKQDADDGKLPGRFVAGEWRFSKAALLDWLAAAYEAPAHQPEVIPPEVVRKAKPDPNSDFVLSIGLFADDETLEPMVEEIYRARKHNTVGD